MYAYGPMAVLGGGGGGLMSEVPLYAYGCGVWGVGLGFGCGV